MTERHDVVVVGGGGAGLAAAIAAAEGGARVALLEQHAALGGSTAWSVGSVSVNRTAHQRRAGISDSADDHFEDMERFAGALANRDNRALRRLLVDRIADTFEWLGGMGLVFVGPNPEPPHRVARMHNVVPSSRAFPDRLGQRARALGVQLRLGTAAVAPLLDGARVTGVSARDGHGREWRVEAAATVLAGGDYSASAELLTTLAGADAAGLAPVNPGANGAGLQLGQRAGGVVVNGDLVRGPVLRFVPPPGDGWLQALPTHPWLAHGLRIGYERAPRALVRPLLMRFLTTALGLAANVLRAGAILVNRDGERFTDETGDAAPATARQPGGEAFVVFDAQVARRCSRWPHFISTAPGIAYAYVDDYRRTRADIFFEADSVAAAAARAGLPDTVAASVARYNEELDADTGRPALREPPFLVLGPIRAYLPFTEGGLAVDPSLRVLDAGGKPIGGLYAAGANGQGGLLLEGHGHHLGWAFVSGRIAGRNAARASRGG